MTWRLIPSVMSRLTRREGQVLVLVVAGLTSRQIGETLGISARTVELHRARITTKLKARNIAELVRIALTGE